MVISDFFKNEEVNKNKSKKIFSENAMQGDLNRGPSNPKSALVPHDHSGLVYHHAILMQSKVNEVCYLIRTIHIPVTVEKRYTRRTCLSRFLA